MTWENDKELTTESKFIRFPEGKNEYVLQDEGQKVRDGYGNARVEFTQPGDRILSIRPGVILEALREAKKKHGTLVNCKLRFVRTGLGKEDTRYTDVQVV